MPARRSAGHSVRLKSCGYACRTTRKRFPDAGSTPAASTKFRSRTVPELPGIFCIPPPPYCQTQHPRSRPYNTAIPRAACRRIRSNAFARNSINPQTCSHEPDFAMRLNSASNIKLSRTLPFFVKAVKFHGFCLLYTPRSPSLWRTGQNAVRPLFLPPKSVFSFRTKNLRFLSKKRSE